MVTSVWSFTVFLKVETIIQVLIIRVGTFHLFWHISPCVWRNTVSFIRLSKVVWGIRVPCKTNRRGARRLLSIAKKKSGVSSGILKGNISGWKYHDHLLWIKNVIAPTEVELMDDLFSRLDCGGDLNPNSMKICANPHICTCSHMHIDHFTKCTWQEIQR